VVPPRAEERLGQIGKPGRRKLGRIHCDVTPEDALLAASWVEVAATEDALADALGWRERRSKLGWGIDEHELAIGAFGAVVRRDGVWLLRVLMILKKRVAFTAVWRRRANGHGAGTVVHDREPSLRGCTHGSNAGCTATLVSRLHVRCRRLAADFSKTLGHSRHGPG
jgi:hypothetical protein